MADYFLGVPEWEAALKGMEQLVRVATVAALAEVGHGIEGRAKRNASGRPGPRVRSGNLRRGIRTSPVRQIGPGTYQTTVGPTMIYSRRIELGFHGTDSRGRTYSQPAYPYFGRAMEGYDIEAIFRRRWGRAVGGAI